MRNETGYTLIELLVVTSIIGLLAAIAIPQYSSFRARGFDAKVASAVRNVATGEEGFYITNNRYSNDVSELSGLNFDDIEITITAGNSGDLGSSFRIRGSHPSASKDYEWVSDPAPGEPNFFASEST